MTMPSTVAPRPPMRARVLVRPAMRNLRRHVRRTVLTASADTLSGL